MRKTRTLTMLLALLTVATVVPAQDSIRGVTVFENRARVERAKSVDVPQGVSEVRFEELTPSLNAPSVAARIEGAEVLGIRLEWQHHEVDVRDDVAALEARLRASNDEQFKLEQEIQIAGKTNSLIAGYAGHLEKTLSEFSVAGTWDSSSEQYLEAESSVASWNIDAVNELDELGRQRVELNREIEKIRYDLEKLRSQSGRVTRTAIVLLESPQAVTGAVHLSYDVPQAYWSPVYEARLDETTSEVEFSMMAAVQQQSGEDWGDVRLTLSTARSSLGLVAPILVPLRISGHVVSSKPSAVVADKKLDERLDGFVDMEGSIDEDLEQLEDLSLAVVSSGGGPVSFEIRVPATIPSDWQPHQVAIHSAKFPAELGFEAIPRVRPHVYRRARFENESKLPFLPGLVHVFREGAFVGDTDIPAVAPGESMKLYFGVEGRITARRHEVRRQAEDAGTFTSDRLITIGYRFDLQNFTGQSVDVFLLDALPVSEIEDVTVALTKRTQPAPQAQKKDGSLEWKVALDSGQERSVNLEYTVRHPANTLLAPDWFE